jgi:hypothetical protein
MLNPYSIIKPLSDPIFIFTNNGNLSMYTKTLSSKIIEEMSDYFFPIFLQEYIDKKFEIRTFYIDGEFYSAAIFSQKDEQTKVDFRNYRDTNPNRIVPFMLDEKTQNCLKKTFKEFNLNTGSVDLIYTPDEKIFFLEINPVGQFGMISFPCNYQLEKVISEKLWS